MKQLFTLILGLFMLTAFSQQDVILRLDHTLDGEKLQLDESYTHPELGYAFSITRLQYYVSEISITHDGGQTTAVEDTWLLVNAADGDDHNLGALNITNVEGISFYVGVDHLHNHMDPTLWPAGHPLAPQNPSMHWGWTAGYRFACLEGKTGAGLFFTYQIHALGDFNYWETSLPTSAVLENGDLVIIVQADYYGMLAGIDVSSGIIEHGDAGIPATMLINFSEEVFSQVLFTSTAENLAGEVFDMYPNPSYTMNTLVKLSAPGDEKQELIVTDISGKVVTRKVVSGSGSTRLNLDHKGMYFVQLWNKGALVHTEKLIVAQ